MTWLLMTMMVLLGVDLLLVGGYVVWAFTCPGQGLVPGDIAPILAPLVVGAGVLVALISLARTTRRDRSQDFLRSATELLERAYGTLAQLDDSGRPKNSRSNWLAAARFLKGAEKVADLITEESHKLIYREQREYCRARLHDLILPNSAGFPLEYYADKPEHLSTWGEDERPPLSVTSLAVLYRFVRWPAGFEDPIKDEPPFTESEIHQMCTFGPHGLGNLLERHAELMAARIAKNEQSRS